MAPPMCFLNQYINLNEIGEFYSYIFRLYYKFEQNLPKPKLNLDLVVEDGPIKDVTAAVECTVMMSHSIEHSLDTDFTMFTNLRRTDASLDTSVSSRSRNDDNNW
jgi:hypothetical protein